MFAGVCTTYCRVVKLDNDRHLTLDKHGSKVQRALNHDTIRPGLFFAAQLPNDVVAAR